MVGGHRAQNRLYHLTDEADASDLLANDVGDLPYFVDAFTDDATLNTANKYGYDELGNLVRDEGAGIDAIDWTVAGKVKGVTRGSGSLPDLIFAYGAQGHRYKKAVHATGAGLQHADYYVHDAQGNVMAIYRYTPAGEDPESLQATERVIYGSERLGADLQTQELLGVEEPATPVTGNLRYELKDHLGNVVAVVSDLLLDVDHDEDEEVDYHQAEVWSLQDYEPFGSLLPGRNYSSSSYDYGFNGKRKDDEIHGATGTSYDFGARLYDPRVGRWLSLDPDRGRYPSHSPYSFAINSPLWVMDPDGKWVFFFNKDEAEKAAADLNRLYAKQYGVSNAFTTVTKDITVKAKNPAYGFLDWIGIGDEPEFIEQKMTVTYVVTNPDFNWNTDEYTKATFDVLNVNFDIVGDIIPDNGDQYKKLVKITIAGLLADRGGGLTLSSREFILSDALKQYGEGGESIAGVMLHELLYHLHPLGDKEEQLPGSLNRMKDQYQLPRGIPHGSGDHNRTNWSDGEMKRLDQERAKTGPKKEKKD